MKCEVPLGNLIMVPYQSIGKVVVRRSRVRRFPSRIKKWAEKSLDRLIKLEINKKHLSVWVASSGVNRKATKMIFKDRK